MKELAKRMYAAYWDSIPPHIDVLITPFESLAPTDQQAWLAAAAASGRSGRVAEFAGAVAVAKGVALPSKPLRLDRSAMAFISKMIHDELQELFDAKMIAQQSDALEEARAAQATGLADERFETIRDILAKGSEGSPGVVLDRAARLCVGAFDELKPVFGDVDLKDAFNYTESLLENVDGETFAIHDLKEAFKDTLGVFKP